MHSPVYGDVHRTHTYMVETCGQVDDDEVPSDELCRDFLEGRCTSTDCRFAHTKEELQEKMSNEQRGNYVVALTLLSAVAKATASFPKLAPAPPPPPSSRL